MPRKVAWSEVAIDHLPAEYRVGCFEEVNLGYTAEEAIVEAQRCIQCASPACEVGCPNNNPIRDFIDLIAEGKFDEAAELDWTQNALLSCTGRVCAWENQCQGYCVMGLRGDPINIGALERFMSDYVMGIAAKSDESPTDAESTPDPVQASVPESAPSSVSTAVPESKPESVHGSLSRTVSHSSRKVAVVGAGPAGLTVAHFLGRKGFPVTVFDSYHLPGGVMSYGIPEFVLPQRVIDAEVERIQGFGVEFRYGVTIGKDITIDELFHLGYDAVFVGIGANAPSTMNIPGEDLNGVWTAKDFLMRASSYAARRGASRPTSIAALNGHHRNNGTTGKSGSPPAVGRRAAVIGAGNTAMDAARTAIRLGAEEVTIVYRRSEAESPSRDIEVGFAKEEGVRFRYLVNPTRFIGDGDGNLTAMELVNMRLETADASGRPRPVPVAGSEHVIPVDTCIIAIGYGHEDLIPKQAGLSVNRWGGLIIDEDTGATNRPGVFAGGDCVTGAATVVHAVAAGRRAAAAIERYLMEAHSDDAPSNDVRVPQLHLMTR